MNNKINEVYESYDYNQFKLLDNNRDIRMTHVNKLMKSMEKRRLISPILVNESREIIDGQHRFEAQKRLKLPIPFIVQNGYGKKEAQILNINTSNWTLTNWLRWYSKEGIKDYIVFKQFKHKYKFEIEQCSQLLSGVYNKESFINGLFIVKDYNNAVKCAEMIWDFRPYFKDFKERMFIRAILDCFKNKDYNHSRFLKKLSFQGNSLIKCVDKKNTLRMIEGIYNYKTREENQVRFF
tara:strand:+ start:307 stop:1017 length:711 start_codon:yes stop_codon:yes gene_type:complete